jgi:methylated-DNA-protein-cysteine methyltransferase-like protein
MKRFTEAVGEIVRTIPEGEVRTYGAVADEAGSPKASRAVGPALDAHWDAGDHTLPLWRVVAWVGCLVTRPADVAEQAKQLRLEGWSVRRNGDRYRVDNGPKGARRATS